MKYKPYFSRFLNERKRKLKAAYIAKVITGVVAALVMSSTSFTVLANDQSPLAALGIEVADVTGYDESENEIQESIGFETETQTQADESASESTAEESAESESPETESSTDVQDAAAQENAETAESGSETPEEPEETEIAGSGEESLGESAETTENVGTPTDLGGGGHGLSQEEGAFADYQEELAKYEEVFASYVESVEYYRMLKEAYRNGGGEAEYEQLKDAYDAMEQIYYTLVDANLNLENARGNVDLALDAELQIYKDAVKEYKAAKAAYNAAWKEYRLVKEGYAEAMEQYDIAMAEYKAELADYAKELTVYAEKLADFKLKQASYELEQKQYAEEMFAEQAAFDMEAPKAPSLVRPVKPELPPEPAIPEPEAPVKPVTYPLTEFELEDFDAETEIEETA
jgi:fibronectin-binding protein A